MQAAGLNSGREHRLKAAACDGRCRPTSVCRSDVSMASFLGRKKRQQVRNLLIGQVIQQTIRHQRNGLLDQLIKVSLGNHDILVSDRPQRDGRFCSTDQQARVHHPLDGQGCPCCEFRVNFLRRIQYRWQGSRRGFRRLPTSSSAGPIRPPVLPTRWQLMHWMRFSANSFDPLVTSTLDR